MFISWKSVVFFGVRWGMEPIQANSSSSTGLNLMSEPHFSLCAYNAFQSETDVKWGHLVPFCCPSLPDPFEFPYCSLISQVVSKGFLGNSLPATSCWPALLLWPHFSKIITSCGNKFIISLLQYTSSHDTFGLTFIHRLTINRQQFTPN